MPFEPDEKPAGRFVPDDAPASPQYDDMSGPEKFLTGIGAGMYDVYKGVQVIGAKAGRAAGIVSPDTVSRIEKEREEARQSFAPLAAQEYHPSLIQPARAGRFVGEVAPFAPLPGGTTGGLIRRTATGGLSGAVQGAVSDTDQGRGALLGGLLGGAGTAGLYGLDRAGGVAAAAKGGKTDLLSKADNYGIPLTLAERKNAPRLGVMETMTEKIPFSGMVRFRKTQQEAADTAAKRLIAQYIADPAAGDIMGANRELAAKMYDSFKGMLPVDVKINPAQVKTSATRLLDDYPDIFKALQDTKTEKILKDIVSGVKDVSSTTPAISPGFGSLTPGAAGSQTTKLTPKILTFDEAWTLRQGLGDLIGQARLKAARGDINRTAVSKLNELFGAVSKDMESWASSAGRPDITRAFTAANDAYKNYVVKYDVLQRAYDKAAGTAGAGEMFSPKTFSTELKKMVYKDKHLGRFTPKEIDEMAGLANIMQIVKRSGQYAENVATGNRAVDLALGMPSPMSKYAIPSGVLITFLTTTKAGQNMLLGASKLAPSSPAMAKIMNVLYQSAPKLAIGAAGSYPVAPAE